VRICCRTLSRFASLRNSLAHEKLRSSGTKHIQTETPLYTDSAVSTSRRRHVQKQIDGREYKKVQFGAQRTRCELRLVEPTPVYNGPRGRHCTLHDPQHFLRLWPPAGRCTTWGVCGALDGPSSRCPSTSASSGARPFSASPPGGAAVAPTRLSGSSRTTCSAPCFFWLAAFLPLTEIPHRFSSGNID